MRTVDNTWWWAHKMPETCRILWQNKFWILDASSWLFYTKCVKVVWHIQEVRGFEICPPSSPQWLGSPSGPRPPRCLVFTITLRRTTLARTLGQWSARRRDLYLTTQHSQHTDILAFGGIRTHNPNKPEDADPWLRRRGHWDWLRVVLALVRYQWSLFDK